MKKIMAILLAVSLMFGAFSGCSSASSPQSQGSDSSTEEGSAELTEISVIIRNLSDGQHPNNDIWPVLDKKLREQGIALNLEVRPSTDYAKQCSVLVASGDYPDMMEYWCSAFPNELEDLSNDGVIRPLDDLIDQYGENIKKYRPEDRSTWIRNTKDGKTYSIPCRTADIGTNSLFAIRQDWLDNLNLEVPTNFDELYEVLTAFKTQDPDGDGDPNNTIPFSSASNPAVPAALFCSPNGVVFNQWNLTADDKLEYYRVMPEYKGVLTMMRTLYQDGLLDSEYALMQQEQFLEKFYNNQIGCFGWWMDQLDPNYANYLSKLTAKHPEAKITVLDFFPDENGTSHWPVLRLTQELVVFSDTTDEQAAACVKLADFLLSDDGYLLTELGLEGEHWNYDENQKPVSVEMTSEQQAKMGYRLYNWIAKRTYLSPAISDDVYAVVNRLSPSIVKQPIDILTPAEQEYKAGLKSLLDTAETSIIIDKDADVDKLFDEMVRSWYENGGQQWTDEMNEAYQNAKG